MTSVSNNHCVGCLAPDMSCNGLCRSCRAIVDSYLAVCPNCNGGIPCEECYEACENSAGGVYTCYSCRSCVDRARFIRDDDDMDAWGLAAIPVFPTMEEANNIQEENNHNQDMDNSSDPPMDTPLDTSSE